VCKHGESLSVSIPSNLDATDFPYEPGTELEPTFVEESNGESRLEYHPVNTGDD
jgi:hypothetical protein